jgi:hypothetical protein
MLHIIKATNGINITILSARKEVPSLMHFSRIDIHNFGLPKKLALLIL